MLKAKTNKHVLHNSLTKKWVTPSEENKEVFGIHKASHKLANKNTLYLESNISPGLKKHITYLSQYMSLKSLGVFCMAY